DQGLGRHPDPRVAGGAVNRYVGRCGHIARVDIYPNLTLDGFVQGHGDIGVPAVGVLPGLHGHRPYVMVGSGLEVERPIDAAVVLPVELLLGAGVPTTQIVHGDFDLVLARSDAVRHLEFEGEVAAVVRPQQVAVQTCRRAVVAPLEHQEN